MSTSTQPNNPILNTALASSNQEPWVLRAHLSIDGMTESRRQEDQPNAYGGIYGHPIGKCGETIQLIVSTYPPNAKWKLEFENYSNPALEGTVYTGAATVNLPVPDRFGPEYRLHRVFVKPAAAAAVMDSEVVVSFWSRKEALEKSWMPTYHWQFDNENLIDVQQLITLAPDESAKVSYRRENTIRGKAAKCEAGGTFFCNDIPFGGASGATIIAYVRGNGANSKFGFEDIEQSGADKNSFLLEWNNRQPVFHMPKSGYTLAPGLTAAVAWEDTESWHQLAMIITPIGNLATFKGVSYDQSTDRYTWISPRFGSAASKSWAAQSSSEDTDSVADNNFYMACAYVDGMPVQEMIFTELKSRLNSENHCLRTLGNGHLVLALNDTTDHVDELVLVNAALTEVQLRDECACAGITVTKPMLHWNFENESLIDSAQGVELLPVDTAVAAYSGSGGIDGKYLTCGVLGCFERANTAFDASNGATFMGFVRGSGLQSKFGFYEKGKSNTDGNSLVMEWSYRQPSFWCPKAGYQMSPGTTTALRWANTTVWNHLAMTITPIDDFLALEGVTYNASSNSYSWTSTRVNSSVRSWKASGVNGSVDVSDFYLVQSYLNGVLLQEMVFSELKSLRNSPTHALRSLGLGNFCIDLKVAGDCVDGIMLTDYPLTEAQIKSECLKGNIATSVPERAPVADMAPLYRWDFANNNVTDSLSGLTLAPMDDVTVIYDENESLSGTCIKVNTVGEFGKENMAFDATGGATLIANVRGSGSQSMFGFYERGKNGTTGNSLAMEWVTTQPHFWCPKAGSSMNPGTTTANRWEKTTWHQMAITLAPINDLTVFEGVSYNETQDRYIWRSTKTGKVVTKNWNAKYASSKADGVDGNDFYIVRGYVDGILLQEMIIQELKSKANSPDHCLRNLGAGYLRLALKASGDSVNDLFIADYALTEEQIVKECEKSGIPLGERSIIWATAKPVTNLSRPNKPADISAVQPTAYLKAWAIDAKTIAVAGDYMEWFRDRMLLEFGDDLSNSEWNYRHAGDDSSLRDKYHYHALWSLYDDYQPVLRDKYDTQGFISVAGKSVTLAGRWHNSNREVNLPDFLDGTTMLRNLKSANIIHVAYLSLDTPMEEGVTYNIYDADGNATTLTYGLESPSAAIKVNQSGYSPDSTKRYAYLGFWLGTGGAYMPDPMPTSFQLVPADGGTPVFTGTLAIRKAVEDDFYDVTEVVSDVPYLRTFPLTGENIWELDISSFSTEGTYRIYIPGIGYSYPFDIGVVALGRQFYYSMWGMFHQRSGIAKTEPYTKWESPEPAHVWTFGNKFASENPYNPGKDLGAYDLETVTVQEDATGTSTKMYKEIYDSNPNFQMIRNNRDNRIFRHIRGGWMDAADFDRRAHHLQAVDHMTLAYLYFPENFTDQQLHIPESGDGIPDILSEVEWGLDYQRRGQTDAGGIGAWIEAPQHEAIIPWTSAIEYCISEPSCRDSLRYAFSAVRFARALKMVGTPLALAKAAIYEESAIRAFAFGANPDNVTHFDFWQDGRHWVHTERYESGAIIHIFRAAAALYAVTGDTYYTSFMTTANFNIMEDPVIRNNQALFYWSPELLFDLAEEFPTFHATHRSRMLWTAQRWLDRQQYHAYRWLFWDTANAGYMKDYAWGLGHPGNRGWLLLSAYKLTEGQGAHVEYDPVKRSYMMNAAVDFKAGAHLALDWAMGCNSLGRSMTIGVGHNYPVWHLCSWLPSIQLDTKDSEGRVIEENIPGITPYQLGNGDGVKGLEYLYYWNRSADSAYNYAGINTSFYPDGVDASHVNSSSTAGLFFRQQVPVQRRYNEVGGYTVSNSEYTIWEIMAPLAALAGCLMGTGFQPDASWKLREPKRNRYELDGYIFLP